MQGSLRLNSFYIYYFGLVVLVAGLPSSVFLMSLSLFIMFGAWLLSGNPLHKFRDFFHNRLALVVSSVLLLHFIGLLYTTDMQEGLKDVRIKLPLFLLPLFISTMPKLDERHFRWLLYLFCASVFTGTMISMGKYFGLGKTPITDPRQIALVSHIRFSLMICMAIFILAWSARQNSSLKKNLLHFLLAAWFIFFLFLLESLTGIVVLLIVGGVWLSWLIFKKGKTWMKLSFLLGSGALVFLLYYTLRHEVDAFYEVHETADIHHLDTITPHGHHYLNDLVNNNMQNGYYTGIYQCWEEMEPAWNKRSTIKFMDEDKKGNLVRFTLIRYLASKGLRKDEDGVNALSEQDVRNIENGFPDYRYPQLPTLRTRIDGIIWEFNEYFKGKNPSGHSVTQRFEFWRAAAGIIKKNPLIGVGTGDQPDSFKAEYAGNGTQLTEKYRLRSHNQFLAITVAFGIIGLLWFCFALFYPLAQNFYRRDFFYLTFFMIALISFINEDTLETQAGVTFFAFFNALFLFARKTD